ncbi:hypothetical protein BJV74DRAFT_799535 [Russula compacta]|nr:hypothetical protein BJV74DRAFT_799535 [Russula compacta]
MAAAAAIMVLVLVAVLVLLVLLVAATSVEVMKHKNRAVYSLASQFTRGLLFGPKSLYENATSAAKGVINGTIGQIWQITKLHFVLLPDKGFTLVRSISGIEYEKDCKNLKCFLLLEADHSTVQEIVKF